MQKVEGSSPPQPLLYLESWLAADEPAPMAPHPPGFGVPVLRYLQRDPETAWHGPRRTAAMCRRPRGRRCQWRRRWRALSVSTAAR